MATHRILKGIFPPIITPFTKNFKLDYKNLNKNLSKLNKTAIKGILVQGSNGEFSSLNEKERIELIEKSKQFLSNDKILLAGSGCEGTQTTIDMTNDMAQVGADAAVVITPSYYKGAMDDQKLVNHFLQVADHSKIPIVLYNVPKFTNVHLSAKAVLQLFSHENIIGMKESDGACISEKIPKICENITSNESDNFLLMAGSAGFISKFYDLGGQGAICALANVLPDNVCQLHQDSSNLELQNELVRPNDLVTAKYGIAGLKYAMEILGYYGGPVRSPLMELGVEGRREIDEVFVCAGCECPPASVHFRFALLHCTFT